MDTKYRCQFCRMTFERFDDCCYTDKQSHKCLEHDMAKPNVYPDASFYEEDVIREPHHYAQWVIEPKEFIMANDLDFATGNVIKYLMRHEMKNGKEDLEKAKEYIDWLIKEHYQ